MSCDAAASLAFLWLAATGPMQPVPLQVAAVQTSPVAREPLFADIVKRAGRLKAEVAAFQGNDRPIPEAFKTGIDELSKLDMQGHLTLAKRGGDGDLKCILRGISQDLPLKLAAVTGAPDRKARDAALKEMTYLLNDNVEVITAPPAPPV
ncbi:MAG TPA: hypothetical protein VFW47_06700 [Phenylobacterium sp.]|nr:hypothetical protein [Phenylobacterium sp.]